MTVTCCQVLKNINPILKFLYNMILDKSTGRLDEIRTYAKEHDLLESFNNTFSRLEQYSNEGCSVTLFSDFAPLSMESSITDNDKLILYGGFIFHGPHDGFGNGGAPTFSVCLDPDNKPGWRIHT
jgi:hypothetical protein